MQLVVSRSAYTGRYFPNYDKFTSTEVYCIVEQDNGSYIISVNVCLYGASAFIIQVKDFLLNQVLELNGIFKSHSFKTRLSIYWIRKGEKRSFPVNLFSLLLFKELIQINIEQCATYYQCYLVFYYVFSHQILMIISKPIQI